MASTRVQLRDLVKANTDIQRDPNFRDTLLDRWINDAQREVQLKLFHLGYTEFKSSDALTLTAAKYSSVTNNVRTAPLSTDCPTRMGVPNWLLFIEVSDTIADGTVVTHGVAYPIPAGVFKEHLRNTYLAPTVNHPICTVLADKLYLAPVGIDTATAHYYKEVTDMSADSSTLDLPESFSSFVTRSVEMRVEDRQGKLQDKQAAMIELDNDLGKAFQAVQIQKTEEPQTVSLK